MPVAFHANCVAVEEMDDFWLVGFADDKFNPRDYLTLQRSFEDDEQEIALGMNTYHVERNDQRWSGYGGIAAFELKQDRVMIRFTTEGAATMGAVTELEISFRVDGEEYSRLKDCLGRIFAGTDCLAEVAERNSEPERQRQNNEPRCPHSRTISGLPADRRGGV